MQQKVAFFDVDGTIFRSSLLIELVEGLIAAEVFPVNARDDFARSKLAWENREGTYETYINDLVRTFMKHLKGKKYGDVLDVGRVVVEEQQKKTYRYTVELLEKLRKQNYYIVAISQSPKMILDLFCEHYHFDKVYGRIYELGPLDCFTGKVTGEELIMDKRNIVLRVLENEDFTTEASVAVGDSEGDISMLDMVAMPICFNPNNTLFQHAKKMGWKVVVERKDVIYEI